MNRRLVIILFWVCLCSLLIPAQTVSAQIESWSTLAGSTKQTRFFPTQKPAHSSSVIQETTITVNASIPHGFLTGDFMGDGHTWLAYVCKKPLTMELVNPLTQEIVSIPLLKNSKDTLQSMESVFIDQIVEYDGEPGPEILCTIGSYKKPVLFEIVSPKKRTVLKAVYGFEGVDTNGDNVWDGQEGNARLFQSPSKQWKIIAYMSADGTDKIPRGLNVYDVAAEKFESRLDMAGGNEGISYVDIPGRGIVFLVTIWSPDNGYATMFDGQLVSDAESYMIGLQYNEAKQGLDWLWYHHVGNYLSGSNMINLDANGRYLACKSDYVIRPFDAESPGRLHVYDLISGEHINTVTLEAGFSMNYFLAPEGTDEFFASIQEEPGLIKIDRQKGLAARMDYSDPAAQVACQGITDMDGDGEYDVVTSLVSQRKGYIVIYDSNLKEKYRLQVPTSIGHVGFADADQDGYPEMYYPDKRTNKRILSIEYATPAQASVDDFDRY